MGFLLAGAVSTLVALSEIAARYRDNPGKAIGTFPAFLYCLLNFGAACLAFALWTVVSPDSAKTLDETVRGFLAGVGALAFLRASVFQIRIGAADVPIGPAAFLNSLLEVLDREVDRKLARFRAQKVALAMKGLNPRDALESLPTFCMALMQNLDAATQEQIGRQFAELEQAEIPDAVRSLIAGLYLSRAVGWETLEEAAKSVANASRPG